MTTKNIKINFINGDTLTYEANDGYALIKDLREFIGSNTGNYHLDLIESTGKKIIFTTMDDNLTCVYTDNTKCVALTPLRVLTKICWPLVLKSRRDF